MKALIVIDMQRDFIDGSLGTAEAAALVPRVAERIRNAGADWVAVTLDTHGADYTDTQEGQRLPVPHCVKGTPGWALHPAVEAALPKGAERFEKGAFGSVALMEALPAEVCEVELMGLCTDICVISNAMLLKAHRPEVRVCVRADCCAGVTQESHATALAAMRGCQIDIV